MYSKLNTAELITFIAFDGNEYVIKSGRGMTPKTISPILDKYAEIHNNPDLSRKGYFIEQLKEGWLKDTTIIKIEEVKE